MGKIQYNKETGLFEIWLYGKLVGTAKTRDEAITILIDLTDD